jgi:hypothetical protein
MPLAFYTYLVERSTEIDENDSFGLAQDNNIL